METPNNTEPVVPQTEQTIINPEPPVIEPTETEKLQAQVAEYQFKEAIGEVSKKYPYATEYKDQIQMLVKDKGYSVEDAALVVLNKENKLQAPVTAPAPKGNAGFGGSMDNPLPQEKKPPEMGTPEAAKYYEKQFKEMADKGEIRIV